MTAVQGDRFGVFGGRYVPETLIPALDELERAYADASADASFQAAVTDMLTNYVGRPSPLSDAPRFSEHVGATVWLKREDLNHTGAHKINNTVGQALLARRMGKRRIIAETGAAQHGVATATVCARQGLARRPSRPWLGASGARWCRLTLFSAVTTWGSSVSGPRGRGSRPGVARRRWRAGVPACCTGR